MFKGAELAPTGTVTLAETIAFFGLLLATETTTGLEVSLLSVTVSFLNWTEGIFESLIRSRVLLR